MSTDEPPQATQPPNGSGDESIKVEVVPPEEAAEKDPVKELEGKVAALEKEKKDNWDRYLRAAADLENSRKRQKRELDDAKLETKNRVLKEILPVVDNLERAVEHTTSGEAAGQPFDPNLHEAISQAESDQPPGTVVQVLQRGYRQGDRLLRPALVVVAKAPATKSAE